MIQPSYLQLNSDTVAVHALAPSRSTTVHKQFINADHSGVCAEQGSDAFVGRACLLAACGWDACKLSGLFLGGGTPQALASLPPGACEMQQSVLGCSMCGARAGLWTFAQHPGPAPPAPPPPWEPAGVNGSLALSLCAAGMQLVSLQLKLPVTNCNTAWDPCINPQACTQSANTCQPPLPSSHTIIHTYTI